MSETEVPKHLAARAGYAKLHQMQDETLQREMRGVLSSSKSDGRKIDEIREHLQDADRRARERVRSD